MDWHAQTWMQLNDAHESPLLACTVTLVVELPPWACCRKWRGVQCLNIEVFVPEACKAECCAGFDLHMLGFKSSWD